MASPTESVKVTPVATLSLKDVAELIVKAQGFHDGFYDLAFNFNLGFGAVGPSAQDTLPGVIIGIAAIGIQKTDKLGPHTVDASQVNPAPTPSRKTTVKRVAK